MSDPNNSHQQTRPAEHEFAETTKPDTSPNPPPNFAAVDSPEAIVDQEYGIASTRASDEAVSSTAAAAAPEAQNGSAIETLHMSESASGLATSDADDGVMAREIERRASEHLARRAAEMSLGDGDGDDDDADNDSDGAAGRSNTNPAVVSSKEHQDLPQTPPPPMPPRKDSAPPKPVPTDQEYDEKHPPPTNEETPHDIPEPPQGAAEATGAEIENIMTQFSDGMGGLAEDEIMSPMRERQQSVLILPPRSSSLEPQPSYIYGTSSAGQQNAASPITPQGTGTSISGGTMNRLKSDDQVSVASGRSGSIYQPPPPSPDPEPALPFDFHRFLEQLRHRTADPVARFLRSFLNEFGKKQWMVHEQVKIISDFLEFITKKMAQCEVWRQVSDAEFDNAREGMEKLVMNRLYSQTFSPAILPAVGSPRKGGRNGRPAADQVSPHGQGRRGQHQEDVEKDEVIAQKIRIYGWIKEEHLDIKPLGEKGKKFLGLAQQELLKINTYRAPRDKVICVLNCCKVIFGFLRNSKSDQSADAFVPLLIYTVLQARPEHLASNVQYIWRFRNQDKLGGEAGYYMSSLMGVVTFVENLDRTTLTISDEDFERNVEQAVSAIAEKNRAEDHELRSRSGDTTGPKQYLNEKRRLSRAEVTPRNNRDAESSTPGRIVSHRLNTRASQSGSPAAAEEEENSDPVAGLLRSIQKPLSSIGRMFSDDTPNEQQQIASRTANTPLDGPTPRRLSPVPNLHRTPSGGRSQGRVEEGGPRTQEEAALRQASAETAQAQRVRAQEHRVVVDTLQSMFPNLDKEVIEDVVRAQEGNVGRAVDACLALSG